MVRDHSARRLQPIRGGAASHPLSVSDSRRGGPAASIAAPPVAGANSPSIQPWNTRDPSLGSLTARIAEYAELFQREISAVVAEERYVQIAHPWRGGAKGPDAEHALVWNGDASARRTGGGPITARRELLSDVLLVQAKDRQWIGYRDVAVVDGKAVRDRTERVRDLFLSGGADSAAEFRRIAFESARYNLGDFRRDLNIPTVALSFMRKADQWRFQFERLDDETIDGQSFRVLAFKEKARPTLIATSGGVQIPVEGRIWLDADDGRVVRTELRFARTVDMVETRWSVVNQTAFRGGNGVAPAGSQDLTSLIRVAFRPHPDVSALVPVQMWEYYETAGGKTIVECLATYSSVRRFQVSTAEQIK
jgi:hypothetical protein